MIRAISPESCVNLQHSSLLISLLATFRGVHLAGISLQRWYNTPCEAGLPSLAWGPVRPGSEKRGRCLGLEQQKTDVVVVGSGLAGLFAAIKCKQVAPGLSVTVCSKSPPGLANCSALSMGNFRCAGPSYDRAKFISDTLLSGVALNEQERLEVMVDRIAGELSALEQMGVTLTSWGRGLSTVSDKMGRKGIVLMRPLLEYALSLGIKILHPYFAWNLLLAGDRAAGVGGYYGQDGEYLPIEARAVVLATGGAGALYARTDNPPGITGDGYGLAWRAGLPLTDMEFVQFYPLGAAFPGKAARFLEPVLADAGTFVNNLGEDIVEKYEITRRPLAEASRDTLCRAMVQEVLDGRGRDGAVRLAFNFTDGSWERAGASLGLASVERIKNWTRDYLEGESSLPVMPVAHFFCGGINTDSSCRTALGGLFAPGEVAAGLHGANRLGGNALSEALVYGSIAGQEAAAWADAQVFAKLSPTEKSSAAYASRGDVQAEVTAPGELRRRLSALMWENAGPVRREEGLKAAAAELEVIRSDLNNLPLNEGSWRDILELENLLLTAHLVTRAARDRKESRGCHYRADHPQPEKTWEKRQSLYPHGA